MNYYIQRNPTKNDGNKLIRTAGLHKNRNRKDRYISFKFHCTVYRMNRFRKNCNLLGLLKSVKTSPWRIDRLMCLLPSEQKYEKSNCGVERLNPLWNTIVSHIARFPCAVEAFIFQSFPHQATTSILHPLSDEHVRFPTWWSSSLRGIEIGTWASFALSGRAWISHSNVSKLGWWPLVCFTEVWKSSSNVTPWALWYILSIVYVSENLYYYR